MNEHIRSPAGYQKIPSRLSETCKKVSIILKGMLNN